ncbi:hypothetical protein G3O08_01650 [Cryomorpha ignava]|uniref:Uncharacterized protein n=1 Tax=Cryomorpha ignava TaxID=101383 RepID=A0A7K3WKN1_9FLAO|nr:hypothetical protein [Cryomorpha ignava]NEN22207.1 hypothetical protein [Cryomorpha ignava]
MKSSKKVREQKIVKVRQITNLVIVTFLLLAPIFFVSLTVLQEKNATQFIMLSSEEQNERHQSSKECDTHSSKLFLNGVLKCELSAETIKAQSFASSDNLVKSRPKDDVQTPPPRIS